MMMNDDTNLDKDSTKAYLKYRGETCCRSENFQNYKVPPSQLPVKSIGSPKAECFRQDGKTNLPFTEVFTGNGPGKNKHPF